MCFSVNTFQSIFMCFPVQLCPSEFTQIKWEIYKFHRTKSTPQVPIKRIIVSMDCIIIEENVELYTSKVAGNAME